jgi:hypothetical protein
LSKRLSNFSIFKKSQSGKSTGFGSKLGVGDVVNKQGPDHEDEEYRYPVGGRLLSVTD